MRARIPLVILAFALALGSLWPGTPVDSWSEVVAGLRSGMRLGLQPPVFVTILERFVTFFPLGLLVWRELARPPYHGSRLVSWPSICLFALVLELAQSLVESRHARLTDFLLATGFGWLGVEAGAWLGRPPNPARVRRLLLAALVTGNLVVTLILVEHHLGAALEGWDCDFPLVVANEASDDRPWQGSLRGIALYGRSLAADAVAGLAALPFSSAGLQRRQEAGALMAYRLDRVHGRRLPQALPHGPRLDLLLPPSGRSSWQPGPDALELLGPTLIRGERPPRELCTAIVASGAFAVEVALASTDPSQEGPARIVSQSIDPFARNFTVGQDLGALVFRVRTPDTGPNGLLLELRAENALLDTDWHHVVATFGDGVATLFLDGRRLTAHRYYKLVPLNETRVVPLALFAAAAFAATGLIVALLKPRASWRSRLAHAYLGATLVPICAALLLSLQLGHAPDGLLLAAALAGPPTSVLSLWSWSKLRGSPPAPSRAPGPPDG